MCKNTDAEQIWREFGVTGPSEESDNFKHELRGVIPRSFEHLFNLITREHELVSRTYYFAGFSVVVSSKPVWWMGRASDSIVLLCILCGSLYVFSLPPWMWYCVCRNRWSTFPSVSGHRSIKSQKTGCSNSPQDLGLIKTQLWWFCVILFLCCRWQVCYYFPTKFKPRFSTKKTTDLLTTAFGTQRHHVLAEVSVHLQCTAKAHFAIMLFHCRLI